MEYKSCILSIIDANKCYDLIHDAFEDIDVIMHKFIIDPKMYENMLEHIMTSSYLSTEIEDNVKEFDKIKDMTYEEGFAYVKNLYLNFNGFIEENDITDILITYIMILAYSRGYPNIRLEPNDVCHCSIYNENLYNLFNNDQFTRTMQTLFTIHSLIYDKKDVKQWWNQLSEHCKNIFKIELQKILDNDLQHEYLPNTKYFDEFMSIYTSL